MFTFDGTQTPLTTDDAALDDPPTSDELALDKDEVIPFPHEHSMPLGLELINVFQADMLITTTVGSGEYFKAVLQKHKFGIGVCRTSTHKKEVMRKLKAFVKLMNLVSLRNAPAKDKQLIQYETKLHSSAKSPAASSSGAPPPAASDLPLPPANAPDFIKILPHKVAAPKPEAIVRAGPKLAAFGSSLL